MNSEPNQRRRRKITVQDIEAMAELVAGSRLTASEAARIRGIDPNTFFRWQSRNRNKEQFAELQEKFRAERIKAAMANVEQAGSRDWRASDRYLSHLASERFNDRIRSEFTVNVGVSVPQFSDSSIKAALKLVYGDAPAKAITNPAPVKQISPPNQDAIDVSTVESEQNQIIPKL